MVVVITRIEKDNKTHLLVAPITHSKPEHPDDGIEVPRSVRKHLGLDREPSWIILTELNRFIWPGPDVRPAPGRESPLYDALPEWLFKKIRDEIGRLSQAGRLPMTRRTE